MVDDAEISHGTLRRIADILGVPVECFFDDRLSGDVNNASQCLVLWQKIKSDAGRRAALAHLREIAEEEMRAFGPTEAR